MDDEMDPQGQQDEDQEPQAPEPQKPQDADYWRRKAEEAERKLNREKKFSEIATKYPGLSREDLKGVDVSQWERLAPRLAQANQPAQPEPEPQKNEPPAAERADIAQFFTPDGSGTAPQKISFEEAKRLGGPANPAVADMIRKGLVEGVRAPQ